MADETVRTWVKRIDSAEELKKKWEKKCRIQDCVAPDTRILTADLRWVPASSLKPGDELLAFDENSPEDGYRQWRRSVVQVARRVVRPSYRLLLEDGTEVVSSENHYWFVEQGRWVATKSLNKNRIRKPVVPWSTSQSNDAGYLAGAYDGEGSLGWGTGEFNSEGYFAIHFSQKQNEMLVRVERILVDLGFDFYKHHRSNGVYSLTIRGGMGERLRFLGSVRPERLLNKLTAHDSFGRFSSGESVGVDKQEFIGDTELVLLQTSTRTFVAEGLASHNCYDYWAGDQWREPRDEFGERRAMVNKIHASVQESLPSMYYYKPFARVAADPEHADDPGTEVDERASLLQDTVNNLMRDPQIGFRDSTFIALKEAQWAFGCVEVGYSAEFVDAPNAERPELKEQKDTKVNAKPPEDQPSTLEDMLAEVNNLKSSIKSEKFYVKHIKAKQVIVSLSDEWNVEGNDWVGYWEDIPLSDVRQAGKNGVYENTTNLKASHNTPEDAERAKRFQEEHGEEEKVTLYKIWNLRTRERFVVVKGHDKFLLRKKYKRLPLKFLRFDVDPYHFFPRPPIFFKLDSQDAYNRTREWLRKHQLYYQPRFTYDLDGVEAKQMKKLERGVIGPYVPRKNGATPDVIAPISLPNMSEASYQLLSLTDKEFAEVGGVGGDARVSQQATATQAKIATSKQQVQESFERSQMADFLSDVAEELLSLAIDNMNVDRWIQINVAPDSMYQMELAQNVGRQFQMINADKLSDEATGLRWCVMIDIENMSPISQEEKFQQWMQGLSLLGNPGFARLFAVSPELLKHTLDLMGIHSAREQELIIGSMQQVVQMEMQLAQQSQNASTGVSPQPGSSQPGQPVAPGGPQPGGPAGPGAS